MNCPICNQKMACMTPQHVKMHGITMIEYRQEYHTHEYGENSCKKFGSIMIKPWTIKRRGA